LVEEVRHYLDCKSLRERNFRGFLLEVLGIVASGECYLSEATVLDMDDVRDRHLKNAPVIEAIIDARMVFADPPERVALREFAESLPGVDECEDVNRFEVQFKMLEESTPPSLSRTFVGVRLFLDGRQCAAHIRPDGVSFSKLKPYERWESLESRFFDFMERYRSAFGITPIHRLGVRYINQLELQDDDRPETVLKSWPRLSTGGSERTPRSFSQVFEFRAPEAPLGTRVTQVWDSDSKRFVLDLDAFQEFPSGMDDGNVKEVLAELRREKNELFWGTLTDSVLRRFE
jgi:uncharacterized protein (TIGR04255 family)